MSCGFVNGRLTLNGSAGSATEVATSNGASSPSTWQAGGGGSSAPTGQLAYFATSGGTSISGWLPCDGSVQSQASYPDLYTQMGLLDPPDTVWTKSSQISAPYGAASFTSAGTPLTYGNGKYVAISGSSIINVYTSTDAITWDLTANPAIVSPSASGYGNGIYLIGGSSGAIYTSTDAVAFTSRTSGSSGNIISISYGTKYIYADSQGKIGYSTDSVTWSVQPTGYSTAFPACKTLYDNSTYVALFSIISGPVCVQTSTDAITWKTRNPAAGSNSFGVSTSPYMIRGNGIYVCCSQSGSIFTSSDGKVWTAINSGTTSDINSISYGTPGGTSTYIFTSNTGLISSSTDAITWVSRTSGVAINLNSSCYGNGIFLAVGAGGQMARSTDGTTWTNPTSGTISNLNACVYGSVYIAGGQSGVIRSSTDAVTWGAVTSGTSSTVTSMTYGNPSGTPAYVYGTVNGGIGSSTDAVTWVVRTSGVAATVSCLSYANNTFLAGTSGGAILSSSDATTWVLRNPAMGRAVFGVSHDGTSYTAVGLGFSVSSTDLITWTPSSNLSIFASLTGAGGGSSIAYGSGKWVLTGAGGRIATTTDFATWIERESVVQGTAGQVVFGNSKFVVGTTVDGKVYPPANGSSLASSTDGITWEAQNVTLSVCGLTYGSEFVAVGNGLSSGAGGNGFVYKSNATYSYNTSTQFVLPNDAQLGITSNPLNSFNRKLYIKT